MIIQKELEKNVLSKIEQKKKQTPYCTIYTWSLGNQTIKTIENTMGVTWRLENREKEILVQGCRRSIISPKKVICLWGYY